MNNSEKARAISRVPAEMPVNLMPLHDAYLPAALDLWKRRFGCDRDTARTWLEDSLHEDKPPETFVAVKATKLLGVGVCTASTQEYAEDYIGLDVSDWSPWPATGVLHVLAVDSDHTGEGIGSQLVEKRLQYLASGGADGVIGLSWHRDDHVDSRALFEKYGFEQVAVFDEYYARTHGRDDCPDCTGECECTASLWARSLPGGETDGE